ncbi:MAG: alpha/beta hydrolase [Candidatus Lambdaproteobacteria bacterium]|nr:alpha/beta hydrolase [Candidatus Lambdaproteobacteria bacterium]
MNQIADLYVEWRGARDPQRETVIFLHDGLGAVGSWQDMPERIAAATGTNALVYDRRGYGRSAPRDSFPYGFIDQEVPVLLALLEHLKLPRAHLVGHSDGGSISLVFAAQHPARVGVVVTEAAHVFVEPETRAGIAGLLAAQAAGNTPRWLAKLHGARADALLAAWAGGWLSEAHGHWNIARYCADIRGPLLAIQGEHDDFGTLAQVEAIVSRAPRAERWVVPGCGHTPHAEAPDAFFERVSAFINAHAGQGAPHK